jgi:hypothetical protein
MAGQGIDEIQRLKAAEQMALEQVSEARECMKGCFRLNRASWFTNPDFVQIES